MLLLCQLQPWPLKHEKNQIIDTIQSSLFHFCTLIFSSFSVLSAVIRMTYAQLDHQDPLLASLAQTRRQKTLPKILPRQTGWATLSTCTRSDQKFTFLLTILILNKIFFVRD